MNEAERELLDWAIIGGGIFDIPLSQCSEPKILSLIAAGFIVHSDDQPSLEFIRYQVTEAGGYARTLWPGRLPEPPQI